LLHYDVVLAATLKFEHTKPICHLKSNCVLIQRNEQAISARYGLAAAAFDSVVRRARRGEPPIWIASINSTALGQFLEREIAMHRVEELIEASMVLVQHDWELYRATKAKR
jgi:hypothetical protein